MPLYSIRASNSDEEKTFTYVQGKKGVQKFDPWAGVSAEWSASWEKKDFHFNVDCCSILLLYLAKDIQTATEVLGTDCMPEMFANLQHRDLDLRNPRASTVHTHWGWREAIFRVLIRFPDISCLEAT